MGPSQGKKGERASPAGGFAPTSGPEGSGRSKLKRAGSLQAGPGEESVGAVRSGRGAARVRWADREDELDGLRASGVLGRTGPRERMGWVEVFLLLGFLSISYSLLFLIQTSLNSNTNLNSNHTQLKVCTSMNAQQKFLNLNKF